MKTESKLTSITEMRERCAIIPNQTHVPFLVVEAIPLLNWIERARAALEDEKVYAETAEALLAELKS